MSAQGKDAETLKALIEKHALWSVLPLQHQNPSYAPTPYEANAIKNMRHILGTFADNLAPLLASVQTENAENLSSDYAICRKHGRQMCPECRESIERNALTLVQFWDRARAAGTGNAEPSTIGYLRHFLARVQALEAEVARLKGEKLTQEEAIIVREAIRSLDSGHHSCRYCPATSPVWEHTRSCPYVRSVELSEQARLILDRLQGVGTCHLDPSVKGEQAASPRLPQHMIDAAERMKAVMKPVPLSDAEKLPDPDYGF